MGWWQVNADTLAGSRFVLSPLAETTACLIVLQGSARRTRASSDMAGRPPASYRERLAGDPIAALARPAPPWGGAGSRTS